MGGDLHADETCEHRPYSTCKEGKGGELGEESPMREDGHAEYDCEYNHECDEYRGILALEVGVRTCPYSTSYFSHQIISLTERENLLYLI